jgi:FkbM family methyltransferase
LNRIKKLLKLFIKPAPPNRLRDKPGYRDCSNTIDVLLKHHRPGVFYDIGAHNGDWSRILLETLEQDLYIALFEPQVKHFNKLKEFFADKNNKILFNAALGSKAAKGKILGGGASASLLNANELQNTIFPGSFNEQSVEETEILVLDELVAQKKLELPDVVKIDVQGFELDVFRGAETVLRNTRYLIVELSFIPLYQGQPALSTLLAFLEERKFRIVDFGHQWKNKQGELIQVDAIFKRND